MKPNSSVSGLISRSTILAVMIMVGCSQSSPDDNTLKVSNQGNQAYSDVPLLLTRAEVEGHIGPVMDNQMIRLLAADEPIVSQLDDLDQDGRWDELAFVVDIAANSELIVTIEYANAEPKHATHAARTNLHIGQFANQQKTEVKSLTQLTRMSTGLPEGHSRQYQMEGPAWENDKVGFRLYFDERNGLDIFGKTTSELVMDRVGIDENYHQLQSWGMDILKVGRSLGAGGLAFASSEESEPSLQRLTGAVKTEATIAADGPVRSILTLDFESLLIGSQVTNLQQHISIWAGQHFYRSEVLIDAPVDANLAIGVVNFHDANPNQSVTADYAALSSFNLQGEESTQLGMAVVTKPQSHLRFGQVAQTSEGIEQSFYSVQTLKPDTPITFDFYAIWQPGSPKVNSQAAFERVIANDQQRELDVTLHLE